MLNRILSNRPILSAWMLSLAVSVYITAFANFTFWSNAKKFFANQETAFWAIIPVFITIHFIAGLLASHRFIFKPFLIFGIITAGVSAYFLDNLGVLVDKEMIRNSITTTTNEAKHLLTSSFWQHVLLYIVLPIAIIFFVKIKKRTVKRAFLINTGFVVAGFALAAALILINSSVYLSTFRENKIILASAIPIAPIDAMVKFVGAAIPEAVVVTQPLGQDARFTSSFDETEKPKLLVLIVGETLRAQNFGLSGYSRNTTPRLATKDVISFTDTHSCGTATAVSLPCMFSHLSRTDYSNKAGKSWENLLDVLNYAGAKVEWWDNNTGDKGVASRIADANFSRGEDSQFCREGECDDAILTQELQTRMGELTGMNIIVMHHIGSHGPAYYLRFPPEFAQFKPYCETAQFGDCTREEIIAAYDNTALFTDKNVTDIIELLEGYENKMSSAVLYISDHGESLGENGMYLHGAPYFIAPAEQTQVPFVMWFSDSFKQDFNIDEACLRAKQNDSVSHDNLFHSVLGMMGVATKVKNDNLDLFHSCKESA